MDPNQQKVTSTATPKKSGIPSLSGASKIPSTSGLATPSGIPTAGSIKKSATGEFKPPQASSAATASATPTSTTAATESKLPRIPTGTSRLTTSTTAASSSSSTEKAAKTQTKSKLQIKPSTSIPSIADPKRASNTELNKSSTNIPKQAQTENGSAAAAAAVQFTTSSNESLNDPKTAKENEVLKLKVKDLEEKLETLKLKRAEDRDKIRDYEKLKLQIQQLQEFKTKAQQEMNELNKELVQCKQDYKAVKENFDSYKDEMSMNESRIEEITVDKELAEAKIEEQQEEIAKLNDKIEELQLELDVIKGEIEENGVGGAAASYELKQSEREQERLKGALLKLRDLSLQDKAEINSLRKQNEEFSTKIKALTKEVEHLKTENSANLVQIVELKDQITATLGSVQMIEQLTEQNLDLESKVVSLKETIADLEAINDVNDQLQESAKEEERELRESLDLAEGRIREYEKQMESLKYSIADHENTILKFRDLVKQLQNENDKLNRQYQIKVETEKQTANTQQTTNNFDFKTKFIESKNYAKIVENELNKIEVNNLKKHIGYLILFMNDHFLKRGGDNESILTLLLFKRIIDKSEFLTKEIKEKYPLVEKLSKEDVIKSSKGEQASFSCELTMLLQLLKLESSKFENALNVCSVNQYQNFGSMYIDLNFHEKTLDSIIELLQKNQLDETTSLESLEKTCLQLNNMYKNHLNDEKYDHATFINDMTKYANLSCDLISNELQRIQLMAHNKDNETSEIMTLFKEIYNTNEELKNIIKVANRYLPKSEENKNKLINLNKQSFESIDNCIKNMHRVSKTLKDICNNASTTLMLNTELIDSNNSHSSGGGGIPYKKLEDLAYQACDKVYSNDDSGPYENIRGSLQQINQALTQLANGLENGEFEKPISADEAKINSPVEQSSELYKNVLIEAETLKHRLEAKDEDLKETKKHLKFKMDELSENKVRLSIIEKKYENAQKDGDEKANKLQLTLDELKQTTSKTEKEHLETIEALQQEVDSLQNEKRVLKDKLKEFTKRNLIESITKQASEPRSPMNESVSLKGSIGGDSSALVEEIKQLKNVIKLLEEANYQLRMDKIKTTIKDLPELPKIKKPIGLNSTTGFVKIGENDETIAEVYKKSNDLLKEYYEAMINIKVPEIKNDKLNNKKPLIEMKKQTNVHMQEIVKQANDLKLKLNQIRTKLTPGTHVKTQLNVFPTPEYSKTTNKHSTLVAEISIPSKKSQNEIIDLHLNDDEIKDLFKHLVTKSIA